MEYKFKVSGIMCPKCVARVSGSVKAVDGVESVSVSEDYSIVTVTADGVQPEKLSEAIHAANPEKFTVLESI